jgi:hypothetical protein
MAQQQTTSDPLTPPRRSTRATSRAATGSGSRAKRVASQAGEEAQEVASTVQEKGQQLAGVAARQAQRVKDTVLEQAPQVGSEVVEQGKTIVQEARAQVQEQVNAQSRRLGDSLSRLGNEIRALSEGRPEQASTVQPYVANAADAVYEAADRVYGDVDDIQARGISGVLEDVQAFARRRPGAFLAGAAIAGFGIGRAVRASSSDGQTDADTTTAGSA